jgi:hypothetical protein
MGIIKTFMISTLHNIGIVRVGHDTNKTINFFNLFFSSWVKIGGGQLILPLIFSNIRKQI